MRVLIVDDSPEKIDRIMIVINEVLSDDEIEIEICKNNASTMKFFQQGKSVDLMILDLNLPIREKEDPKKEGGILLLNEITRRTNIKRPKAIIGLSAFEEIKSKFDFMFNKEGWVIAKYSNKETDWEEIIKNKLNYLMPNQEETTTTNQKLPTIVILTAINPEYLAVRANLKKVEDFTKDDTFYEKGIFEVNECEIANIIIRECGAKNNIAAQETERAVQYFSPNCLLFVGIAGSRKPNDFKVGDVIIPDKIYSYESGKASESTFHARPDLAGLSYVFTEKAKNERNKDDWKQFIKGKYSEIPKADLGIIASGEMLIEHYNSDIGKILTEHYNDTSAVEMEGFGFAKALSRQGRNTQTMIFGVVRGISDILSTDNEFTSDRRPSGAKEIACDTASAFAMNLIYKIYS